MKCADSNGHRRGACPAPSKRAGWKTERVSELTALHQEKRMQIDTLSLHLLRVTELPTDGADLICFPLVTRKGSAQLCSDTLPGRFSAAISLASWVRALTGGCPRALEQEARGPCRAWASLQLKAGRWRPVNTTEPGKAVQQKRGEQKLWEEEAGSRSLKFT